MYILKQIPEDFVVTEISNVKILGQGKYLYLNLKKTNRNTLDCVKEIAKQLNLKEKDVGFAGSKDKNAVTTQLVSVLGVSKEKISKIKIDNCELSILGSGNKPISLGDLEGNSFEITIRDLEEVNINEGDIIEIIGEPFKKEKAKVTRVDKQKGEVVVSLLGAVVPIPVTVKIDNVRVIRREDEEGEENKEEQDQNQDDFAQGPKIGGL